MMRSGASWNPTSNEEGKERAKGRGGLRKTQLRWGKPVGGREGAFLKRHDDGVGRRKGVAPDERGSAFFHSAPMHASSTTSRKCVGAGALGQLYFQALSLVELQFCRALQGTKLRMRKERKGAEHRDGLRKTQLRCRKAEAHAVGCSSGSMGSTPCSVNRTFFHWSTSSTFKACAALTNSSTVTTRQMPSTRSRASRTRSRFR